MSISLVIGRGQLAPLMSTSLLEKEKQSYKKKATQVF